MNERKSGGGGDDKAMEGRQVAKDGTDKGDADFHKTGFGFSEDKEKQTLEDLADNVVDLELQQVKAIAANDSAVGAKAYRQLLNRHPEDSRAEEWREAIKTLEKGEAK